MKSASPPFVTPLKSWGSFKRYSEHQTEWQQLGVENQVKTLSDYVRTGQMIHASPVTGKNEVVERPFKLYLGTPLMMVAKSKMIDGSRLAALDQDACRVLASALLYQELGNLREFLIEVDFPENFGRNRRGCSIGTASWLGLAASVGAMEVAERWGPLLVGATRNGYLLDEDVRGMQHWILRLWCRANGLDYPDIGYPRYDVAEGVLAMWDTQDMEMLGTWLVQLCNLHTRLSASRQFMDFANVFSHFPVEVLLLFRLREQAGLANPEVDHSIMKFPWSRLWPIKPAEPDELLAGVYRRLETDEGITVQGLYRQFLAA